MAMLVRRRRDSVKWILLLGLASCIFALFTMDPSVPQKGSLHPDSQIKIPTPPQHILPNYSMYHGHVSRHLLQSDENCTPAAIEQFPKTPLSQEQRQEGAIVIHILITVYMFMGLALVCDDYFVPACEKMCDSLKLSSDVAGATFMAAGSSAPELATAVIGVFIAKDDIGVGSVVGSAVFNIMFVIGLCGLFSGMVSNLTWWPMLRDCIYYTFSIIALVLVIMDRVVHWYEALTLLVMYALYIVLMYFNSRLESAVVPRCTCCKSHEGDTEESKLVCSMEAKKGIQHTDMSGGITAELDSEDLNNSNTEKGMEYHPLLSCNEDQEIAKTPFEDLVVKNHLDEEAHPLSLPDGWCRRILWVVTLPLALLMYLTIPDCRRDGWARWFIVTFTMGIVWIAVYSYVMVWMITIIGQTFGIPDTIMGLTLIAAGSSVPDAIASLLVARDGLADMAVSNAIGSNVFDILLCLGLPWFIKTTMVSPGTTVRIYSAGLTYSALTLLTNVLLLLLLTHLNGWRLTKKYGGALLLLYVAFMILAVMYELNVLGHLHSPQCPSDF